MLAANSAPPAAPTPATVHPNDGLPRPKLLRGSIFSADAEALGFYNVSADVRSEFGVRDVRVSVGNDPAGDAANASVPLAPRPPLRLRLVGVAVSQWPAGPFTWAWALWPDGNETVDFTVVQGAPPAPAAPGAPPSSGVAPAFLARTYYATVSYVLPAPVMQPQWESVKTFASAEATEVDVNFALDYHRGFYASGYDDPEDIYVQRWRMEDTAWKLCAVYGQWSPALVIGEPSAGTARFAPDSTPCAAVADPSHPGYENAWVETYVDAPLPRYTLAHPAANFSVTYPPADRDGYLSRYLPLSSHTYREIAGQGQVLVTSRYQDPALALTSVWSPDSVPAVKAQSWAANYRDGNVMDNPPQRTVPDLLIGPDSVVLRRRTKYVALSRLSDDYTALLPGVTVLEGETLDGDSLLAAVGWASGAPGGAPSGVPGGVAGGVPPVAAPFAWAPAAAGSAAELPATSAGLVVTTQGPYPADASASFPLGFATEVDWRDRHWQFNVTWNDRYLDFRNFRDRQGANDSDCPNLHHWALITLGQCQDYNYAQFRNESTGAPIDPATPSLPQESGLTGAPTSYYSAVDSSAYEECLARYKNLLLLYAACVSAKAPDYAQLRDAFVGDRDCVAGAGPCGPPGFSDAPPLEAYGFAPFNASAPLACGPGDDTFALGLVALDSLHKERARLSCLETHPLYPVTVGGYGTPAGQGQDALWAYDPTLGAPAEYGLAYTNVSGFAPPWGGPITSADYTLRSNYDVTRPVPNPARADTPVPDSPAWVQMLSRGPCGDGDLVRSSLPFPSYYGDTLAGHNRYAQILAAQPPCGGEQVTEENARRTAAGAADAAPTAAEEDSGEEPLTQQEQLLVRTWGGKAGALRGGD